MTTSTISFTFKISGTLWDLGYDPFFQFANGPEANTPDAIEFDEKGYWYTSGNSDGEQGQLSKVNFIPPLYRLDYTSGFNDGAWKRKVYNQG